MHMAEDRGGGRVVRHRGVPLPADDGPARADGGPERGSDPSTGPVPKPLSRTRPQRSPGGPRMSSPEPARQSTGTVVLTGATSGIGEAAAVRLATAAEHLVVHGPQPESAVLPLLRRLRSAGPARVDYVRADFGDLDEVVAMADRIAGFDEGVDVLVNNAGRSGAPERRTSANGYESTLQTNYLAAVLLTERLRPLMPVTGRVVHVASAAHLSVTMRLDDINLEHDYDPVRAYAQSKLALVAHALWQARVPDAGAPDIVSISPGVISTRLLRAMFAVRDGAVQHGAANLLHAALSPDIPSGSYVDDGRIARPGRQARDHSFQVALHLKTRELLAPWT